MIVGFGLAMLLNRDIPLKGLITTLLLLPMMLSMAVVGPVLEAALRPVLGHHQLRARPRQLRMAGRTRTWRSTPSRITDIWMWSPFVMLLSLAGLSAVPKHLYEAAAIDRAGPLYTFFRITLPLVAPILMIAIIFRTMEAFKTFDLAYILTSQPTTEVISIRLYKMAFQEWQTGPVLRARLHRADHGAGDHQHLREVPEQGEGALRWPPSAPPAKRVCNRVAIVAVLVVTLIFLAPIYWITSTAFKPRNLATTVPPTVFFEPEITPFVKLFTKRVQLREPPTPEDYAAAPWWEQLVFDGGEKVVRDGKGEVQLSGYPNRFMNS